MRCLRFYARYAALTLLLLLFLNMVPGTLRVSDVQLVSVGHQYNLIGWEVRNFPEKWVHKLRDLLPGEHRAAEARKQAVVDYFAAARSMAEARDQFNQVVAKADVPLTGAPGPATVASAERALDDARAKRERLRPGAEEAVESVVTTALRNAGLASRTGFLWPPVDVKFQDPPQILLVSPRERIALTDAVLLHPDQSLGDMERMESQISRMQNVSALVDTTGGLASFPAVVSPEYGLRWAVETSTHEWTHHYLFFRPLGKAYFSSQDMRTVNETVADMVGAEAGRAAYDLLMGTAQPVSNPLAPPPDTAATGADQPFDFVKEMRTTRLHVDAMLSAGQRVDDVERFMEERRWEFVKHGYAIRKLNQAYFAFYGSYGDSPASSSPILGQLRALRASAGSVQSFLDMVSRVRDMKEFNALVAKQTGGT